MSKTMKLLAAAALMGASLVPSIVLAQGVEGNDQERVALFVSVDENEKSFDRVFPDGQREPLEIPVGKSLVVTDIVADGAACPSPVKTVIISSSCIYPIADPTAVQISFLTRFDPAAYSHIVNLTAGIEFPAQCPPVVSTECLGDLQVWAYGFLVSQKKK